MGPAGQRVCGLGKQASAALRGKCERACARLGQSACRGRRGGPGLTGDLMGRVREGGASWAGVVCWARGKEEKERWAMGQLGCHLGLVSSFSISILLF